jgi:branched-chain amino acid transport system ATP-binding protein
MKLIVINEIHVFYGEGHILHGITLNVNENEFVGIIGRNGVGKSTLLKSVIGLLRLREGSILFKNQEITNLPPHKVCRLGIGYVPQGREIFPDLSVFENLKLGTFSERNRTGVEDSFDFVFNIFPVLKNRLNQKGSTLSGGEQQMLAIARAIVGNPDILLLDEPNEGLAPFLVKEIESQLRLMNRELGLSMILVEQNIDLIFRLVDRAYLLEKGAVIREGPTTILREDDFIRKHLSV